MNRGRVGHSMSPPRMGPSTPTGYSGQKRATLLFLKRSPDATLAEVAHVLGTSKVAALRHLASLENDGLVHRTYRRGGRGGPPAIFRLASSAGRLFPEAYTQLAVAALGFIEKVEGRTGVVRMLEGRAQDLRDAHRARRVSPVLGERARELAHIRDEEGYMADLREPARGTFELREHNCPILAVAGVYGEACDVERRLFRDLLRADVVVSHRVVAGDPVCRFLIRANRSDPAL